jgi:hypothetical protein
VRRYLKEFLADPRVIEDQGLVWQLVLNGIILPLRPRRKARDYRKIWNEEANESPLKTITRAQAQKLGSTLEPLGAHIQVDWAMRYGNPSISARMGALVKDGYIASCDPALSAIFGGDHRHGLVRCVPDPLRQQPTGDRGALLHDRVHRGACRHHQRDREACLRTRSILALPRHAGEPCAQGRSLLRHCACTTELLRGEPGSTTTS